MRRADTAECIQSRLAAYLSETQLLSHTLAPVDDWEQNVIRDTLPELSGDNNAGAKIVRGIAVLAADYTRQASAPVATRWTLPACPSLLLSARIMGTRRVGGTINIMKPPPPAPDTLPPSAPSSEAT